MQKILSYLLLIATFTCTLAPAALAQYIPAQSANPTFSSFTTSRTAVNDANYTQVATDYLIALTANTSAHTITLITTGIKTGQHIIVKDESGVAGTNNITIAGTIDGAANKVINSNYGDVRLYYSGSAYFTE